ncbi:unnamed protein product [Arctia plantaginis]|uniref:Uncharacterized protein n=1 Tax=Arctia plantaginis TaxID=874455 RepID=A0A8S0Z013_ARCPL|nr:unnamed protein product [Arctia plantaginis]
MKILLSLVYLFFVGSSLAAGTEDNHVRPCQKGDLDCIKRFFATNFKCTPGSADSHIIKVKQQRFEVPVTGMTVTIHNAQVKGLDKGQIQEFYINNKTDILVMEVTFDQIVIDSERTEWLQYHIGRAPTEVEDYTSSIFKDLKLTMTILNVSDLNSSSCYVYALIPDASDVNLIKGPGLSGLDVTELFNMARDAMLTEGKALMEAFLRSQICDLKCEI